MPIVISLPPSTLTDTYEESYTNTSAAAGLNTYDFATVPAGEVWMIYGGAAWDVNTKITNIEIAIARGGSYYAVCRYAPSAAQDALAILNSFIMVPGDFIRMYWGGCTLNDDIHGRLVGLKFAIDLGI